MAKKKTARASQDDDKGKREPVLGLRLDPVLIAQVRESAAKHRRTLTAEVSIALEEYLQKGGFWPPPGGRG